MSATQHTPTPWHATECSYGWEIHQGVEHSDEHCWGAVNGEWLDAFAQADAEHICRVVNSHEDLLEALRLATKELNAIRARDGAPQHIDWWRGCPIQTDGCSQEWWSELTERCFSAIAKAEGREENS